MNPDHRRNSAVPDNNDTLIASATTPEIRLFKVPVPTGLHTTPLPPGTPLGGWGRNSSSDPDAATGGMNWTLTSPATIPQFSAICYLTAKEISQRVMCEMGCAQGHTVTRSALHGCQRGLCLGRYLSCCGVHCVCLCVLLASACHMGLIQSCLGSTDVQSWMSAGMREEARQTCWAEDGEPTPAKLPVSRSNAPSSKSLPQLRPCCPTRKSRRDVVRVHLCQRPVGRRLCCSTPCSHRLLGLRLAECCGTRVKTTLTTAVLASTTACSPLWSSRGASFSQVRLDHSGEC